jgi:CheY-like chemotaxis protein
LPPTAKRVLCVDGNNDTREILTTLLGGEGHETRTAGGAGAALMLASAEKFDLIIVTTPLPDGEAWAVRAAARTRPRRGRPHLLPQPLRADASRGAGGGRA